MDAKSFPAPYRITNSETILSPGLVIFRELIEKNLQEIIRIAGGTSRLRPHCKTHKMREVTAMELADGIDKHKAATFAECEMLADVGVKDIVLAYNIVGPNIARAVTFVKKYPNVKFTVTADHPKPVAELGAAMTAAGATIRVLLDVDTGQHRTGVIVGPRAKELYQQIAKTPGLIAEGFHVYDGHQHQEQFDDRRAAVLAEFTKVLAFRDELVASGLAVPRILAGGTGSFPVYAQQTDPAIELSPGTCVFWDSGYNAKFPDLHFTPAAILLTRVISRPTNDRVTVDLGTKAVASDPPAGKRLMFPTLPDAEQVLQNEEHLVLQTSHAEEYQPGDELFAFPTHICPTSALHKQVFVVSGEKMIERWDVASRDRWLTV
ncbi:MAG: D-TA family PLP-dependent enzyme [Planctomycetota bacterium]|nr:D-TA family PLP-dependent enzyme [Planctomycetota bacterium]MDA1212571.1 D-TA family PLP-dependent enzyme [Planctomycetota bacterium]